MRNGIIVPSLVSTLHAVIVAYHPDGMSIQQRQNIFHYGYTGFFAADAQIKSAHLRLFQLSRYPSVCLRPESCAWNEKLKGIPAEKVLIQKKYFYPTS